MNWSKYLEMKEKGFIDRVRIGGVWVIAVKRFDANLGTPLQPEIITITPEQVKIEVARFAESLKNFEALYADLTATA